MSAFDNASFAPFPQTQWSLVVSAAGGSEGAMARLAGGYCNAVYAFFRRDGHSREDAADLTQEFFAEQVLDPERRTATLKGPGEVRAKFRTWLRGCLVHFAMNARKRAKAEKRGGGRAMVPLDVDAAERGMAGSTEGDPAKQFDRQWAQEVLERTLRKLMQELNANAAAVFRLTATRKSDAEIGESLGMTADAVAKSRSRSIARAREMLAEELQESVESGDDLRAELEELARVYGLPAWLKPVEP